MASPNTFGSQQSSPLVQRQGVATPNATNETVAHGLHSEKDAFNASEVTFPPDPNRDRLIEFLEWTLKVLGFAAACVFGAWAPLSYKATLDGNTVYDTGQKSMVSAALAASSQAHDAASQQRVAASHQTEAARQQSKALETMNSKIGAIGQLWLYEFCLSRTNLEPCETFRTSSTSSALITTQTSTQTMNISGTTGFSFSSVAPVASTSASATSNGEGGGDSGGSNLTMPAILGIVFGVLILLGLTLGFWLFRIKRRRHVRNVR